MNWSRESLLEELGLAQLNHRLYSKKKLHIDKGEIDPVSHGGVALITDGNFTDNQSLSDLDMRYWAVYPDGRIDVQHLFQIETEELDNNRVALTSLYVLGREIDLNDSYAVDMVMEAIRQINIKMRDREPDLPHLARIFKDCNIQEVVGETLPLPGFHLESRLYFPISQNFNLAANADEKPELVLPLEAIQPLAGIRYNTVDIDHSYPTGRDNVLRTRMTLPQVGRKFEIASNLSRDIEFDGPSPKNRTIDLTQREPNIPEYETPREMIHIRWDIIKGSKTGKYKLDMARVTDFRLLKHLPLRMGFRHAMSGLGVLNRTHTDMLKSRDYPRMLDHLALYGHTEAAASSESPPPKRGRLVLTSKGGNNLEEVVPGIGEDIGGNCKVCATEWIDPKTDEVKKLGVIFDLGAYIMKIKSEWTGGGPDILEELKYCKNIFISHHHLDHLDFIIPYLKNDFFKDHTLHMTPEVYEKFKDVMTKWTIKGDDPRIPEINLLEDAGVMDLKDDNGTIRMSVAWGADAVPHSAKDTPFIAYGRNGKTILGSYMYLGDMRYDEEWFDFHDSAFWDPVGLMLKHDDSLDPDHLVPTYTEIDGTSVKQEGSAPRESQVEANLTHIINNWFTDKAIGVSMIGTNDGRRETLLRVGNSTGRRMTSFGSAVEKIFAIGNKYGINKYRYDKPSSGAYTGIKDYIKWDAEERGLTPTDYKGRTSKAVKEWFEHGKPEKIMAFMSGSQGNPIEIESMTYRLADGLSHFDADPKHRSTARSLKMKDLAVIISQSAIPGNAKYQKRMIKKLAGRGCIVLEAYRDNLRVHISRTNPVRQRILNDIAKMGRTAVIEADGAIVVEDFPIHASGHGRKEDFKKWLKKIKAKQFGLHHTDDKETVMDAYQTIESEGKAHPGGLFENNVRAQITNERVERIGRTLNSVIMTKELAEEGKHYNKELRARRMINLDKRSPHADQGLRSSNNGVFETEFGAEEMEELKKRSDSKRTAKSEWPENRSQNCRAKDRRRGRRKVEQANSWSAIKDQIKVTL